MTPSADVYLKRADTLPTGAFKVRDGVTVISRLGEEFHDPDLIAASTGNHGQSVAYAGRVFDDARERAEALAAERGYQYVHSANKPALVAGVGTARLEVVEELPGVDYLFSPVGGGGGCDGLLSHRRRTYRRRRDQRPVGGRTGDTPGLVRGPPRPHDRMETFAGGVATRVPFAVKMGALWESLDEFRLVSETAIEIGVREMLTEAGTPAEGASATSLAAMREMEAKIRVKTDMLPSTGRNVSPGKLRTLLAGESLGE